MPPILLLYLITEYDALDKILAFWFLPKTGCAKVFHCPALSSLCASLNKHGEVLPASLCDHCTELWTPAVCLPLIILFSLAFWLEQPAGLTAPVPLPYSATSLPISALGITTSRLLTGWSWKDGASRMQWMSLGIILMDLLACMLIAAHAPYL